MLDYAALQRARLMSDHATPPARMVGGDLPVWDADMEYWLNDALTVLNNMTFRSCWSGLEHALVSCSGEIGE